MILFSKLYTDVIKLNKQYRNSKANCIVATLHKAQTNYKYGTQLCVLAIKPPGFSIHQVREVPNSKNNSIPTT